MACVITSISLDHMQFLGNTVREIAGEKAGIIVPGVPVIYDGNDKDAAEVIAAKAKELGSPAYKVIQALSLIQIFGRNIKPLSFLYSGILTSIFSIVVNGVMHFKLKTIDMVESLKRVE